MYEDNRTDPMPKASFQNGHALVVAAAAYGKISPLPDTVVKDARDVVSVLTSPSYCGYSPQQVSLLLNEQATLEALRRGLESLASRAKSDDTVIVYFSGHGARLGSLSDAQSILLPIDSDPVSILTTTMSEAEFSTALARIKAGRLVVFIDACHSGAAGSFKTAEGAQTVDLGFSEKSLNRLAQGTGRVLIASSRASETSLILAGATNSLFTQHLIDALRGAARTQGDGLIRVFEIFNYVSEKVRNAMPGQQHPIFKASDLEDNFPIALDRGGTKSPFPQTPAGNGEVWRQLEDIFADLYPAGPLDQEIWARAGGDTSLLRLNGTGRANWFSALRTIRQGGGGAGIRRETLIKTALGDFPHHVELDQLLRD